MSAHRVDLRDRDSVDRLVEEVRPEVVVHTAYRQGSRDDIVTVSANVAEAAAQRGSALVHLSSDMVFGGDDAPYDEFSAPTPVSEYGSWKLQAEELVREADPDACITRTSLVISSDPFDPASMWLLDSVRRGETPTLFDDEMRSPILATDLASALWRLVAMPRDTRAGIWHLPGPEVLSRYELGLRILSREGCPVESVRAASAAEHPDPRPRDLSLTSQRVIEGFHPLSVG